MPIGIEELNDLDIRIGLVQKTKKIKFKKKYYLKLSIDFGPDIGIKTSILRDSNILHDDLVDRQIVGVVNIKPKIITGVVSDVLLLGSDCEDGRFSLLVPNRVSRIGSKVY